MRAGGHLALARHWLSGLAWATLALFPARAQQPGIAPPTSAELRRWIESDGLDQVIYYLTDRISGERICAGPAERRQKRRFARRYGARVTAVLERYHRAHVRRDFIVTSSCYKPARGRDLERQLGSFDPVLTEVERLVP